MNQAGGHEPVPTQQEMPFAIVQGTPVVDLPTDLYIPPDALEVFLDAFEGPLDLLLYLLELEQLGPAALVVGLVCLAGGEACAPLSQADRQVARIAPIVKSRALTLSREPGRAPRRNWRLSLGLRQRGSTGMPRVHVPRVGGQATPVAASRLALVQRLHEMLVLQNELPFELTFVDVDPVLHL